MQQPMLRLNEEYKQQGVAVLSLSRTEKMNALNNFMVDELNGQLDEVLEKEEVKVLVMKSDIMKAFCTGIDVKYVKSLTNEEACTFFVRLAKLLERIIHYPLPTIAAVNGYAHGAGADIALSCDLRIGGISSSYRFPGPQFGLVLGTKRLIEEIGPSYSRFLTLTNEIVDAGEALRMGLIHERVIDDEVFERAIEQGIKIANMPSFSMKTIRMLTNNKERTVSPVELTEESVLESDFQERFAAYLKGIRM